MKLYFFCSDYCQLANYNGCGQCALIGVWLLFEGSDYNIEGLAAWGYYSRAASDGRIKEIRHQTLSPLLFG